MNTTWTIDELREAFKNSEFQLEHLEPLWSASAPGRYFAEFRAGKNPATFQFTFDSKFPLSENFQIVREEVADFPTVSRSAQTFGD